MANRINLRGTTNDSFDIGETNKLTFDSSNLTANRTLRFPDSNGSINQVLSTDGSGNLSWANPGGGSTDTSSVISFSAGTTGLLPNTASTGTITLSGTLSILHGGTGATTNTQALLNLGAYAASNPAGYTSNTGTVTSVGITSTDLIIAGSPITSSGTINLSLNTVPISKGGTGATTNTQALLNLGAYAASNPAGYTSNTGTVTSVGITSTDLVITGGPISSSGSISVSLNTVPISKGGTGATTNTQALLNLGAYAASNPAGYTSNTGTVTSVGITSTDLIIAGSPITSSGSISVSLNTVPISKGGTGATTNTQALLNLGAYAASNPAGYTSNTGTVTSVRITSTELVITGSPITSSGTINLSLNTVSIEKGGTGATGAIAAFNALSPATGTGDLIYFNGANNVRLPIGQISQVLVSDGNNPTWTSNNIKLVASKLIDQTSGTQIEIMTLLPFMFIDKITIAINFAFNSGITFTVGTDSNPSEYITASQIVAQNAGRTDIDPDVLPRGSDAGPEALKLFFNQQPTAGSMWIIISYVNLTSAPDADFTGVPTSGFIPLTVNFYDNSPSATSWLWDFKNNGTATSTLQSPSYTYTESGTYTVKLISSNLGGSSSKTKPNYVTVIEPGMTININTNAPGATNTVVLPLYGSPLSCTVYWGDGTVESFNTLSDYSHTYTSSGQYTINIVGTVKGFGIYGFEPNNKSFISISKWDGLGIQWLEWAFAGSSNLVSVPNTLPSTVTLLNGTFYNCTNFNSNISTWNTSNVTSMGSLFYGCTSFNQNISSWDVSNVNWMNTMFYGATSFNQPIGNWNVSVVAEMSGMFQNASSFNQNLSSWCVSLIPQKPIGFDSGATAWTQPKPVWGTCPTPTQPEMIINIDTTASGATTTVDLPFSGTVSCIVDWGDGTPVESFINVGKKSHTYASNGQYTIGITGVVTIFGGQNSVRNKSYISVTKWDGLGITSFQSAFSGASNLTSVPNSIPTSVTSTSSMFENATSFNQDISSWDVSNVKWMSYMFWNATAFNQNIGGWDVSNVIYMFSMFRNATAFNQDISSWNVSNVTDMDRMFDNAMTFNQDLSGWCVSNIPTAPFAFSSGSIWTLPKPVWGTCPP